MALIEFEDKENLRVSELPRKNKVTAEDLNEIKSVVNQNAALPPVNIYTSDGTIEGLDAIRKINLNGKKIKFENGQLIVSNSDIDAPDYKLVVIGDTGKNGAYLNADKTAIIANGEIIGVFGVSKNGVGIVGESTNGIGIRSRSKGNVFQDISMVTQTPDPSSILDTFSENHGSRPFPCLTTAQRNAIESPADYLTIVNKDTHRVELYHPTFGWVGTSEKSVFVQNASSILTTSTYYVGVMPAGLNSAFTSSGFLSPYTGKITKVFFRTRTSVPGDRSISVYVRIDDTTDYLVQTINDTNTNREFINVAMNTTGIPVIENTTTIAIKIVASGGTTDATSFISGGTLIIQ